MQEINFTCAKLPISVRSLIWFTFFPLELRLAKRTPGPTMTKNMISHRSKERFSKHLLPTNPITGGRMIEQTNDRKNIMQLIPKPSHVQETQYW